MLTKNQYKDNVSSGRQEGKIMSLGVALKGPEGIVLAADSRVTITAQIPGQPLLIPATFDNASKLLSINGQAFVGAVTYGAGAIGLAAPRTAYSFLPEFEEQLKGTGRMSVEEFAKKLSEFFLAQWNTGMPSDYKGPDMVFLVGGYDKDAPYGRVFEVGIPSRPEPIEQSVNTFGITYGGQREFTDSLLQGFRSGLPDIVQKVLNLPDDKKVTLTEQLKNQMAIRLPIQFLALQDCVDLSIFLIRTTMTVQTWTVGVRGVGGAIDVATITRTNGFKVVQRKTITGDKPVINFSNLAGGGS